MYRYAGYLGYEGTNFHGWQKNSPQVTVQETIENVLYQIHGYKHRIEIYGAGRTDTGVHSIKQGFHFDSPMVFDCSKLQQSLTGLLRKYRITVYNIWPTDKEFHARFSAKKRIYMYHVTESSWLKISTPNLIWYMESLPSIDPLNHLLQQFVGQHNFKHFCTGRYDNYWRTIESIEVKKEDTSIFITVTAPSFLYHQIRFMIGTVVKNIKKYETNLDYISLVLEGKIYPEIHIAPPSGLFLKDVIYS